MEKLLVWEKHFAFQQWLGKFIYLHRRKQQKKTPFIFPIRKTVLEHQEK